MLKMRDFRGQTSLSVKISEIGGHCVKRDDSAYASAAAGGRFAGQVVSCQHCRQPLQHVERKQGHRRPAKGVSLPFIRNTQRSP